MLLKSRTNFQNRKPKWSKIHLPAELWLLVCELLRGDDRRSLSLTCRALFSLVLTNAPFRQLKLRFCRIWDHVTIRQHSESFSSARTIHWSIQQYTMWWGEPQRLSTNSYSLSAVSFRHVLSVLSGSSCLHTLGLTWLNVESAHQKLILSIKTLRCLKLMNSGFAPTSVVMPRSSITTLWLEESSPEQTRHLLKLTGSSLETLILKEIRIATYEVLARTPLPRLALLEQPYVRGASKHDHFGSFTNIRVLIISSLGFLTVPPTALPQLTYLSGPNGAAKAFLPGRPVCTYRMHSNYSCCGGTHVTAPLRETAPHAQRIEELQLSTTFPPARLAGLLAELLPNIVRVRLMMDQFKLPAAAEAPHKLLTDAGHVHRSLREFDIGFSVKRQPFPREGCWKVLMALTEVCPALEVVRFGELFPVEGGGIDERDVALDRLMDMRQTAEGEWREMKWGVR